MKLFEVVVYSTQWYTWYLRCVALSDPRFWLLITDCVWMLGSTNANKLMGRTFEVYHLSQPIAFNPVRRRHRSKQAFSVHVKPSVVDTCASDWRRQRTWSRWLTNPNREDLMLNATDCKTLPHFTFLFSPLSPMCSKSTRRQRYIILKVNFSLSVTSHYCKFASVFI